jgi:hypothetical protein
MNVCVFVWFEQLPAGSLLKNTFRPMLFKKMGVGAKTTEEQLIKWLREIKGGVKNFLSRGDNGKGGASGVILFMLFIFLCYDAHVGYDAHAHII